eukprot:1729463-Amphidinium_carterae.1
MPSSSRSLTCLHIMRDVAGVPPVHTMYRQCEVHQDPFPIRGLCQHQMTLLQNDMYTLAVPENKKKLDMVYRAGFGPEFFEQFGSAALLIALQHRVPSLLVFAFCKEDHTVMAAEDTHKCESGCLANGSAPTYVQE